METQLAVAMNRAFGVRGESAPLEIRRAIYGSELRSIDEKARTLDIISSTERIDRYGDRVKSQGIRTQDYMKSGGPILWSHDTHTPPVAKTLSIGTQANPPALLQQIQFADHDFAETIFQLYRQKFLTSFSIGFRPLSEPEPILDQATGRTTGFIFHSVDLIETSCVSTPANPSAVAKAIESGACNAAEAEQIFHQSYDLVTLARTVEDLGSKIDAMHSMMVEMMAILKKKLPKSVAECEEEFLASVLS